MRARSRAGHDTHASPSSGRTRRQEGRVISLRVFNVQDVAAYRDGPFPVRLPPSPQLDGHHVGPDGRELQPPAMFLCPITQVSTCVREGTARLDQLRSCCRAACSAP